MRLQLVSNPYVEFLFIFKIVNILLLNFKHIFMGKEWKIYYPNFLFMCLMFSRSKTAKKKLIFKGCTKHEILTHLTEEGLCWRSLIIITSYLITILFFRLRRRRGVFRLHNRRGGAPVTATPSFEKSEHLTHKNQIRFWISFRFKLRVTDPGAFLVRHVFKVFVRSWKR